MFIEELLAKACSRNWKSNTISITARSVDCYPLASIRLMFDWHRLNSRGNAIVFKKQSFYITMKLKMNCGLLIFAFVKFFYCEEFERFSLETKSDWRGRNPRDIFRHCFGCKIDSAIFPGFWPADTIASHFSLQTQKECRVFHGVDFSMFIVGSGVFRWSMRILDLSLMRRTH